MLRTSGSNFVQYKPATNSHCNRNADVYDNEIAAWVVYLPPKVLLRLAFPNSIRIYMCIHFISAGVFSCSEPLNEIGRYGKILPNASLPTRRLVVQWRHETSRRSKFSSSIANRVSDRFLSSQLMQKGDILMSFDSINYSFTENVYFFISTTFSFRCFVMVEFYGSMCFYFYLKFWRIKSRKLTINWIFRSFLFPAFFISFSWMKFTRT